MKKVQMGTFILALVISIIYLVFTLGFSTNYAIGEGYLGQFYQDAQEANKTMFDLGLWIVILVGVSFIFNTHKNKRFYFYNYILSFAIAGLMIATAITTYGYMGPLKEAYLEIDEFMLYVLTIINGGKVSTQNFEQGTILSFVLFFQAFLILGVTGYKVYIDITRAKTKKAQRMEVIS